MATRLPVELMRTLDEKFVADWVAFQTMRPTGGLIVEGAPYRRADGTIDREAVLVLARHLVANWPALRMRVRSMPLGITTPAWVAAEPELAWHVRFIDHVEPDDVALVLGGERNGPLALDRPLWTLLVAGLPDGDVAFVPQVQHALGDGIFALRFIDQLTADAPFDPSATPAADELAPPPGAMGILREAGASWWRRQGGLGAAWREYTRKPFPRRLRRTGGRILRPRRLRRQQGMPLPHRHHAFRTLDLREVKLAARAAGCSVHDLAVAASLLAASRTDPAAETALLVPVSRRAGTTGDERNNISMTEVSLSPGSGRAEAVAQVGAQLGAFIAGDPDALARPLSAPGYTSYLPWRVRPRYAGAALVREVVLWPVLDPRHPFAVFAGSYASTFSIAVSGAPDVDVESIAADMARVVLGDDDPSAASDARAEVPA
ncbi:wax ester/triacylglycerol synthase family O-acyltransferase [Protaetiibacter mangrovi]|uniref:Wax ester/triacylglycerol synthase family O-acyltransferase n=1 Tax=Protaetiibacter mangrovi TaxID=2970926 RepID=A0ABT1ZBJ1_9MICO|nr:wax ester/triacylglycerol synthase family O-acyltransferase [Protaetiibacter mangrovi]MCS0498054.1 wax ester/triacylglycerol synthase family O-acyltransferase [Protaetiibacter mangrovi]TPX05362.1 hypothetical protein FJ656_06925 [Schumannella luteola]